MTTLEYIKSIQPDDIPINKRIHVIDAPGFGFIKLNPETCRHEWTPKLDTVSEETLLLIREVIDSKD